MSIITIQALVLVCAMNVIGYFVTVVINLIKNLKRCKELDKQIEEIIKSAPPRDNTK